MGWASVTGRLESRERERERQGGPYGPGSFARSLNLKEEEEREREREREREGEGEGDHYRLCFLLQQSEGSHKVRHSIKQRVVGRAKGLRVGTPTPTPRRKKERKGRGRGRERDCKRADVRENEREMESAERPRRMVLGAALLLALASGLPLATCIWEFGACRL